MSQAPPTRVLVVEDDPSLLALMAEWLRAAGHDVTSSPGFEEAKAALGETLPGVLITDVRLGRFNGLHLAWWLRNRSAETPILVISAFEDDVLRQEAARCQATYWVKSASREDFLSAFDATVQGGVAGSRSLR